LHYVIWFSIDSTDKAIVDADKSSKPIALNNPDSSLRPTGQASQTFVLAHFPGNLNP
jgi:hypothetical protein